MRTVRKTESTAYQIHYHFVTPVKYRKGIFGFSDREQTLFSICKEIEERYEIIFGKVGIANQGKQPKDAQLKLFDFQPLIPTSLLVGCLFTDPKS